MRLKIHIIWSYEQKGGGNRDIYSTSHSYMILDSILG